MSEPKATFEVAELFERTAADAVVLRGNIRSGIVLPGQSTKVWIDGQLYMSAPIKAVERVDGSDGGNRVDLVLHIPHPENRALWLALCQQGDLLPVDEKD